MPHISRKLYGLLLSTLLLANYVMAQQTIGKTFEKVILESSRQTVLNYTKYIELIAEEEDKSLAALYKAELLKSVEKDSINVFNDLIPVSDRPARSRDNVERLTTYLNDINSRYLQGVTIVYSNLVPSNVFLDEARNRLFVKITADRTIDGLYHYKNERKPNKGQEKIDFYVQIEMKPSGLPESKIYSVFLNEQNESTFKKLTIVEKTTPIAFNNIRKDSTFKRSMEHTITWTGGELFERLRLELYKGNPGKSTRVEVIDSSFVNDNKIKFALNGKLKPGKGNKYYFQITKLSTSEQPVTSEVFYVKRKTPLFIKALTPIVIAAGVGYFILSDSGTGSEKDPQLPAPIDPGG